MKVIKNYCVPSKGKCKFDKNKNLNLQRRFFTLFYTSLHDFTQNG
jgi:hypothetical protein